MILEIRARDRSGRETSHDVVVTVDPTHDIGELAAAIRRHLDLPPGACTLTSHRTGETFDAAATVADVDLVAGDTLTLDGPVRSMNVVPTTKDHIAVDVIAGPDSGRSHRLGAGSARIGRSRDADIVVDDPSVSRHHATFTVVAGRGVEVTPEPGTANGVTVNDVEIDAPSLLGPDDVVGLGGTRLTIRRFEHCRTERTDRLGQIDFHRTPYRPAVVPEPEVVPIGPIPDRPDARRLQVFAVLAPLAAGLAMYAFTRQLQFLALTLISPVVMVASAFDDRRSGRRTLRAEVAAFRARLADEADRFGRLRHLERVERLRAAPDLADLARRAELRTVDLWPRGRDAPDFLTLRLGLGRDRVRFPIELARGGADDLRDEAQAAVAGLDVVDHVPITVDLCADAVLGVYGEAGLVDGTAASIVVQAATLHSPDDLTIVAAVAPDRSLDWLKWLPHVRSVISPVAGNHVATDTIDATALVAALLEAATYRVADGPGRREPRVWPRVLTVLDERLSVDAADVARLLDVAPAAGLAVVWLADALAGVPRQASRILAVSRGDGAVLAGRLWSTDPHAAERVLEVEHVRPEVAVRAARALAPVRDASTASLATSIPRAAPLLDVFGVGRPSPQWVAERWATATGPALRFPIGVGAGGVVELDLVADGPHTLIGGTSGAGKSELLQSMVASLAAHHPPNRVNFLFVDYKGGASSKVFEPLPHTVGCVTNLDAALAVRALTSLRAELNRRMALLEGRAKDLADLLAVAPDDAPPALVIVVDEFATLVKEVPDFVAGVVDIAQRGRSLGIHLVLATQRPTGAVDENILANTNLRISLRMLDRAESTAVIDSPDAADIPVPLKGRGLIRRGPGQLVEFQSAFAGAALSTGEARSPVLVGRFVRTDDRPTAVTPPPDERAAAAEPVTHLASILDAVVDAAHRRGGPPPRRPWRDALAPVVTLDRVLGQLDAPVVAGRDVVVGLLDDPERQDQRPAILDLEDGGGLLVFGSGGAGKTTLLRTVATAVGHADGVAVVAFDFASRGLSALRELPTVVDVATGDDLEAVTRHLLVLDRELDRRRRLLAEAGAEHLTAFGSDQADAPPRILVLIDGFGGLASTLLDPGGTAGMAAVEEWGERVLRLIVDGRQVGIHTIITADRRSAVPARIHSAVAHRLILRHADEMSYAEHAIGADRAASLAGRPGRGLLQGTTLVQVASVSADPAARAQAAAIAALSSADGRCQRVLSVLHSAPLPDQIPLSEVATADGPSAVVGVADVVADQVSVDLEWADLTVAGPPRSGRSTAIASVAVQLAADESVDVVAVGPPGSPVRALAPAGSAFGGTAEIATALDRVANLSAMGGARRRVLVVDDLDALDDPVLAAVWDRLARADVRLVCALDERALGGYTSHPLVERARRARRMLLLQPEDPAAVMQLVGVKVRLRPGLRLPPGRGILLADRLPTVVQIAEPAGVSQRAGHGT